MFEIIFNYLYTLVGLLILMIVEILLEGIWEEDNESN